MKNIRILILGTGGMANQHAAAYQDIEGVTIVAGVDTNSERLAAFAEQYDIAHQFASLDEAIAWGEFDACSNVTPDPVHYLTTMQLLKADKHVLCEKPLATQHSHAQEMNQMAKTRGLVNMVNLSYRERNAVQKARQMVANGDIGDIRHFDASYLQSWVLQDLWGDWHTQEQWQWKLSKDHGSTGALGDMGIHILDLACFVAGSQIAQLSCRLTNFEKCPGNTIGKYVLNANDSFNMHIELENKASGVVHGTRLGAGHINDLKLTIHGTKGALIVEANHLESSLTACYHEHLSTPIWRPVETTTVRRNYDLFVSRIRGEATTFPDFETGEQLQKVLDAAELSAHSNFLNVVIN